MKIKEVVDITGDEVRSGCKLEVDGAPMPQSRPRLGRNGFFCNPRNSDAESFKAEIRSEITEPPVFKCGEPVVVSIKFHVRRPNTHKMG